MSEELNNSSNTEANGQISLLPLDPEVIEPRRKRGRPPGAKGRWGRILERYTRPWTTALIDQAISQALSGDGETLRFLLDRLWPKPKHAPLAIEIPATKNAEDIRIAMHGIVERVAAGELASDEGAHVVTMLRNVLMAHSIQTISNTAEPVSQASDAREQLFQRLRIAMERRQQP